MDEKRQTISAMFIEEAKDSLLRIPADERAEQMKEIQTAVGNSDDFNKGVLLGIESARVFLAQNVKAIQVGVSL